MKPNTRSFYIAQSSALLTLLVAHPATAQIIPDNTVNTTVTPNGNINVIEGGTRAGSNLFHSFQEFSVPTGREAFFNNAFDVRNIFSRVTGKLPSNIDGLIRANGVANLFLLNPNGIIFGPNARLNIGGSFLATTANSFKFADGSEFSATNPQAAPLLSINVPIGLQYGKNAAEIRVQGKGQDLGFATESFDSSLNPLEVLPGKTLTFVGGNVVVDGGILQAPGGRVEIGGIAGEGTVGLNADSSLSFPEGVVLSDISISNKAGINVIASGGGSITITGRNLDISGESLLTAGIAAGKGEDISLNASEVINISSSRIENNVNPLDSKGVPSIGNSGDIIIHTKSLSVTGGAVLSASTRGQGDAGNVKISATDTVLFDGVTSNGRGTGAGSVVLTGAIGKGGSVEITTKSLSVTGGALLIASTRGQGDAGNVKISATDTVLFDGVASNGFRSGAISVVLTGAIGKGGGVEITTKSLSVTGGAVLDASTFGEGDAGNVRITATDTVLFDGVSSDGQSSGAFSTVETGAIGKGGSIEITAKSLFVTGNAVLATSTFGQGNAGSVKITATDSVSFDGGSSVYSTVEMGAIGKGGDVEITTKSLSVTGGAVLNVSTFGQGDAGNVRITATDTVLFEGESAAFSTVATGAIGKGGGVEITTKSLSVTGGAVLQASTSGQGDAGNVKISATDNVLFNGVGSDGQSSAAFSTVETGAIGKGGDVEITTQSLSVTGGAGLIASTSGQGDAGNVRIIATDTVLFDGVASNGQSSAARSAVETGAIGKGGDVKITTQSLSVTGGAVLAASTFGQGDGGNVKITATDTVLFDGVASNGQSSVAGSTVETGAIGKGGDVEITTKSLSVTGGAVLTVSTFGQGDAGNVKITATHTVLFDGVASNGLTSGAGSTVGTGAIGKGGDVEITTKSLSVTSGAQLQASTLGQGDAGNVRITATDNVLFDGVGSNGLSSAAFSTVEAEAVGNGGGINITTNSLSFTNGAGLTASSGGDGAAGNINLKANSIRLSNEAFIIADTVKGQGNITMESQSLIMRRNSNITTNATGKATGGNITINTDVLAALENSDISANAEDSFGGRVIINAQGIFGTKFRPDNTPESDITATSKLGPQFSGSVQINTPAVDPNSGLVNLPENAVDVSRLVPKGCIARRKETGTFYITGNDGFQHRPGDGLMSPLPTGEVRSIPESNSFERSEVNDRIIEAQGIYKLENGQMVLGWECPK